MFLRLSHAPKIGAAMAFGLIATGIAVSESQTWDMPVPALAPPTAEQVGPPMPAELTAQVPDGSPVNLADAEAAGPEIPEISTSGEPPEIALRLLNRTFAPDETLSAPVQVAEETQPVHQETQSVRQIDMPRRGDELDELGRPVDEPDKYEVAALPQPEAQPTDEAPVNTIDESLVAPIPAPAYRRPVVSYLVDESAVEVDPREPNTMDPFVTGNLYAYQTAYDEPYQEEYIEDDFWPRRLDHVVSVQGQARVVGTISADNLFLTDWVEVRQGGARRLVAE